MERKKSVLQWFPLFIIIAVIIAYFFSWDIGAFLNPDSTAYNMAELTRMINEQINDGRKDGDFYITGITQEEISNINDYICGLNGEVVSYSILEQGHKGMKVRFVYDISENYYVYQKYKYNKQIPIEYTSADKLYDKVVEILDQIIKPGMSDYEKELAIHDYIVTHCSYGYTEYSKDSAYEAYGALVHGVAVCNGYAEAMALLLSCADVENDIMTGMAGGELHAWNRVLLDGEWYQVDATWDDPIPDRGDFAGHMYFNVTDDVMDDSHEWEKEMYEACDSWDYNYFSRNNLICDYNGFKQEVTNLARTDIHGIAEVVVTDYSKSTYNMDFISELNTVSYLMYGNESYGKYEIVTVYLNRSN